MAPHVGESPMLPEQCTFCRPRFVGFEVTMTNVQKKCSGLLASCAGLRWCPPLSESVCPSIKWSWYHATLYSGQEVE